LARKNKSPECASFQVVTFYFMVASMMLGCEWCSGLQPRGPFSLSGFDNAGAPVVATEIKSGNKVGGASADDQTIQHV